MHGRDCGAGQGQALKLYELQFPVRLRLVDWHRHRLMYMTITHTDGMMGKGTINGWARNIYLGTEVREISPGLYEAVNYFKRPGI